MPISLQTKQRAKVFRMCPYCSTTLTLWTQWEMYFPWWTCWHKVSFDLSLARGLDYYTGMIFEVVTSASAPPPATSTTTTASKKKKPANPEEDISESVGVGSICGGGRYDDLVGRFAGESRQIPCVGMSVGIERVFALVKAKYVENGRAGETEVYVMAMGDVSVEARFAIMKELWDAGIKVLPLNPQTYDRLSFNTRRSLLILQNSSSWRRRLMLLLASWSVKRKSLRIQSGLNNLDWASRVKAIKSTGQIWSRLSLTCFTSWKTFRCTLRFPIFHFWRCREIS